MSELFLCSYILTLLDTLDNGGRHKGSFHPDLHGVYMHIALLPLQSRGLHRSLKCRRTINKSQLKLYVNNKEIFFNMLWYTYQFSHILALLQDYAFHFYLHSKKWSCY